jgi:DeoR/GlpR family transcriptional regulator of sugar metabolism
VSDRWFYRQRQQWIMQMLHVYGFINRGHLMRKFEISTMQASIDLQQFLTNYPGVMAYNKSTKRYEAQ